MRSIRGNLNKQLLLLILANILPFPLEGFDLLEQISRYIKFRLPRLSLHSFIAMTVLLRLKPEANRNKPP